METVGDKIASYIIVLEEQNEISSKCKTCIEIFYPQLLNGKEIYNIFAPRHKASNRCESGKRNHCTCDTCF